MTEDQSVLAQVREAATRLFADISESGGRAAQEELERGTWPAATWSRVEEAGFDRLLADDLDGEGWACAAAVFRAMGYHAVGVPLLETVVARGLLHRAGASVELDGPLSIAHLRPKTGAQLHERGDRLVLDGELLAPWGRHASHVVTTGELDGEAVVAVFAIGGDGVHVVPGSNIAGEPRDRVHATSAVSRAWHRLPAGTNARTWGALASSCAIVGAAQRALDLSLVYANDRVQFGRNIGKFQALQHAMAVLSCELAAATMAVQVGSEAAERGDAAVETAVAKIRAGQAAGVAAAIGHQVHGAIGFTDEHVLHHFTRRLWSWRREWGSERDWAIELGKRTVAARGAGVWPLVVSLSAGAGA